MRRIGLTLVCVAIGCAPADSSRSDTARSTDARTDASRSASRVSDTLWLLASDPAHDAVHASDTEADLRARYGAENVVRDRIYLGEGETEPGTIIFPGDSTRLLEVRWADTVQRIHPVTVSPVGPKTRWVVPPGVSLGTSLLELERLNGGPFNLFGFETDGEGTVSDWAGGRLGTLWSSPSDNNRLVWVRLSPHENDAHELRDQVFGDKLFSSSHPAMQGLNPTVYDLMVRPR